MRNIIKLTSFCTFLVLIQSCGPSEAELRKKEMARYAIAINKVLQQDTRTSSGNDGNHYYKLTSAKMRMIDLSACPPDFRQAYLSHIHAWENAAKIEEAIAEYGTRASGAMIGGALSSFFDSKETPFSDYIEEGESLNRLGQRASASIKSTFQKVESIAGYYGITKPN